MDTCLAETGSDLTVIAFAGVGLVICAAIMLLGQQRHKRYLAVIALGLGVLAGAPAAPLYAASGAIDCPDDHRSASSTVSPEGPAEPATPPTTPVVTPQDPPAQSLQLNLPRIAWEGGNSYYSQFSSAANRGWAEPSFFPIALWWGVFENDTQVQWDKSHGINTYIVTNPDDPNAYSLIERNGMSWIGGQLPGTTRESAAWVGDFLDDEVDGRFSTTEGPDYLQGIVDGLPDHNKIRYTNYTSSIVNIWFDNSAAETYVNQFSDTVSIDIYFYTVPFCSWEPFPTYYYKIQIPESTCRTSASYGKMVDMLRQRDTVDGKLQPVWSFIENVSGSPAEQDPSTLIAPDQVKGAAMSSIIHEARGIVWFNNVFAGICGSGNAIRSAQSNPDYPCKDQITAMGQINNQLHSLAPILNTQSYEWGFGDNLETMLKTYGDSAYIFAMPDGTSGTRSFTLPPELASAVSIEVLDEGRSITVSNGTFTDSFANESSYHIYKITLQ